jgi:hypothetical protein
MIILDLQPWSIVNNPGFLRHHAVFTPHFDIGSEKYYRSMLNPAYEKIKLATKVMLNEKMLKLFPSLWTLGHLFTMSTWA